MVPISDILIKEKLYVIMSALKFQQSEYSKFFSCGFVSLFCETFLLNPRPNYTHVKTYVYV